LIEITEAKILAQVDIRFPVTYWEKAKECDSILESGNSGGGVLQRNESTSASTESFESRMGIVLQHPRLPALAL